MTISKQMPMSETLHDDKHEGNNEPCISTMSIIDNDISPMRPVVTITEKDQKRRSLSPDPIARRDGDFKIDCRIQQVEQQRRDSKNQSPDYTNSDLQFLKQDLIARH